MNLPTTSYAVLGLLTLAPMSGYDLAQAADRSIANFWPISKSQVYGELDRLEGLGFVRSREVEQDKRPDKRIYELTQDGAEALDSWLEEPEWEADRHRVGILVKVFFGHRMTHESVLDLIDRYRSGAEAYRDYLQNVVDVLAGVPEAIYQRATALFGLRSAEAVVAWADDIREQIIDQRDQFQSHPEAVAEMSRRLLHEVPPRKGTP